MKPLKYFSIYIISLFVITLFLRIMLIPYYNNNLGGIDLNVVYGIQRLLLGQPLYQDPAAGSFGVIQYTPLYYYVAAGVARLTGIKALNVQGIFELCRVLALLFNLLAIGFCALIIRGMGFKWFHACVFALPVVIVLTSHYYTRGDSLHLLLFVGALWAYLRFSRNGGLPYIMLSALLSAACFMTKQSGMLCMGILGCCLLFIDRRYTTTAIYAACTLFFSAIIVYVCTEGSSLHLFYANTWLGLMNGYDLSFLSSMFVSQYFLDLVPFYLLGGLMVYFAVSKITGKTYRILVAGGVLSWLFAVVTGLKKGSSNNYFTEFLVFILLALPYFMQQAREQRLMVALRIPAYRFAVIAFLILITSKTMGFFTGVYIEKGFKNDKEEYTGEQQLFGYFTQTLHLIPGEHVFFTERRFLDNVFIGYSLFPTRDVSSLVYMADSTIYNYSRFTTGMNSGLINYIVTDRQRDDINVCNDSMPFIWFDKNRFSRVAQVSGYSIYKYLPTP